MNNRVEELLKREARETEYFPETRKERRKRERQNKKKKHVIMF